MRSIAILSIAAATMTAANASETVAKSAYYRSLTAMWPDLAVYSFMVDELLEPRCGRPQRLEHVKSVSSTHLKVLLALKEGRTEAASAELRAVPCEKKQ